MGMMDFFGNIGAGVNRFIESVPASWADVKAEFIQNFVTQNRWKILARGLGNTMLLSLGAVIIGILLGTLIGIVRTSWDSSVKMKKKSFGRSVMAFLNGLCKVYTTVIRGTPAVIQLLILYYIIFASSTNGVAVAMLSFGLNSAAYVSEIIRGGILSIDKGQMEAGRSLGMGYSQTMLFVILPQVLKNILPSLANEFITLLKETSVAGYVSVPDLTYAGNRIRGITYSAFMPLVAVALIYLIIVTILSWLVGKWERRLRQSDLR